MVWGVVALVLLAVLVVCLVQPVRVRVRAPDESDLLSVRVRHPALSLDLWLPADLLLHWIAGIAEPPPVAGHACGVPLPPRALQPVASAIARSIAGIGKKEEPAAPPADATPGRFALWKKRLVAAAPRATWENAPRIRRAFTIELFAFELEYGTGDPVTTGIIAGHLWQLASLLPEGAVVRAEAHWLEPKLRLEGEARVAIFPWRTLLAALCLAFAIARSAWKASRKPPEQPKRDKEIDSWPSIRTETPAVAPPSSPS